MTPERWREVEAIYQSTMDREPEVRAAYLLKPARGTKTCGGKWSRYWS